MALKIAIAGAGMVTRHHMIGWMKVPGVEVVAICNRTRSRAEERAKEFGIPAVYDDFEQMLDSARPDAVDIASAVEVHAKSVRVAASRGIAVFCQKPLTPTLDEARQLVDEVGERVPFMVHENWRFRPQYRQVAEWIAEDRIGPVRVFSMSALSSGLVRRAKSENPPALERQPFLAELKRFIVFELLIHHLDVVRFLVGERLEVKASTLRRLSPDVIGEDTAHILLEGDGGAVGTVVGSFMVPSESPRPQDRLMLVGEKGSIRFEGRTLVLGTNSGIDTVTLDAEAGYQASYDLAIAHFIDCLRSGKPFETSAKDNLETLRLVEDIYQKAKNGIEAT